MQEEELSVTPGTCQVLMSDLRPCGRLTLEEKPNEDKKLVCLMHSHDPKKDKVKFQIEIDAILEGFSILHRPSRRVPHPFRPAHPTTKLARVNPQSHPTRTNRRPERKGWGQRTHLPTLCIPSSKWPSGDEPQWMGHSMIRQKTIRGGATALVQFFANFRLFRPQNPFFATNCATIPP